MRVYDRGVNMPISSYNLVHALKGYKNKNWPIRSCFYKGGSVPLFGRGASTEDVGLLESSQRDASTEKNLEAKSMIYCLLLMDCRCFLIMFIRFHF